jgi:hypothetical protein
VTDAIPKATNGCGTEITTYTSGGQKAAGHRMRLRSLRDEGAQAPPPGRDGRPRSPRYPAHEDDDLKIASTPKYWAFK